MKVTCLEVGALGANCYVVSCEATKRALVVDPGGDAERVAAVAEGQRLTVDLIVDTHCHPDHIAGNCPLRDLLAAAQGFAPTLLIHEADRDAVEHPPMQWLLIGMKPEPCPVDGTVAEGEELAVGELKVKVMHLPGHSPGSIALLVAGAAFTGDTLFAGGIGRTDLPGGNGRQIMASLKRLITELPEETLIYPGHGPSSTLGEERATNGWLADLR